MKNKKLFAILTLVCFLFTLMPVAAMADENVAVDDKGVYFTSLADAVANTTGSTIKILADTTLTGNINKDLKFVGATKDVVLDLGDTANAASSRDLIFENLTLERDNVNYKGFHHVNRETYDNCIINGQYWTYGVTAEFTDCVFNQKSSDAYNIWTYGSEAVKFENCTFNSAGKSVLVYNEGACATVLTVTDCKFNASASVEGKAAIEIDTSLMPEGSKLVIDDKTTATGFSEGTISGNSLYNGKKGNKLSVTVGGVVGKNAYADLTSITVDVDDTSYVNADSVENGTAYRTYVGGITGIAHYNNKFINCTCTGDVTITDAGDTPELEIGGIAGVWHNETGTTVTIQNCSYTGALASPGVTEFANNGLVGSAYNTTGEGTLTAENNTVKLVIPDNMAAAKIGSTNYATLQSAIDAAANGDTITLLTDVTEDVTVVQAETVKITIDGSGKTMNGSITVDGKSARYETAGVTIKNVNFLSDKNSPAAYINLGVSGNSNTRYTNHVTVETCTFDYNGTDDKVAIKSYTGGDKNLIITGCTVSENMHSLLQVTNVEEGLAISDCVVKSKNGVNINNTVSLAMTGCDFAVKGYAIRAGVSGSTSTVTKTFVIKNNVLSSNCDDGDAVIILRDSAANANISMEENAVLGTTHISGTTADTTVSADANYWDGESAPVVSGTAVTVASYYEKFEDGKLKNLIIPATDITFVKNEVSVECGKTVTLTATLAPSDATDEIVWTSSDTTIVTVDEMGNVTGAKEGTATVTVKIANGETATCTVTVTKASSSSSSSGGGFSGKYNYIDQPIPGFGTSASIISDRTYVPIRYVAEKLGANVEWIAATQQIMIEQ